MYNVVSMLYFTSPSLNLQSPRESLNFMSFEIDVPHSDTSLRRTPIFECLVVRCGSKNGYLKGIMRLKEIKLHVENMITILGSIVNVIGGTYMSIE